MVINLINNFDRQLHERYVFWSWYEILTVIIGWEWVLWRIFA